MSGRTLIKNMKKRGLALNIKKINKKNTNAAGNGTRLNCPGIKRL